MRYRVALRESEEGFSVSCPGLPGCWSQGATEEEALTNIQIAIREYLTSGNPSSSRCPKNADFAWFTQFNAYTMGGIVRDAGLTIEEFRKLL